VYGEITVGKELGYSVYNYFSNGGRDAYIVRTVSASATTATATVPYNPSGSGGASATLFIADASSPGVWGNGLTVTTTAGVTAAGSAQIPTFNLSVRLDGVEVERWNEVSTDPANNRYIDAVVNTYSKFIKIRTATIASTASANWTFIIDAKGFTGGAEGGVVGDDRYIAALTQLDTVEGVLIMNAPGKTSAPVVNALLGKAEARRNSFVVIDPSSEIDPVQIGSAIISGYNQSSYGAVYYPQLKMVDPAKSGPGAIRTGAPGGAVVGAFIRTEIARSVAKAPAGYNVDVRNAFGLATQFTPDQTGTLYDTYGVNLFKVVPGGGVIINGARTLDRSTPGKYIPIRRSLNFLKQSLEDATSFAVFEPNDDRLWSTLTMRCSSILGEFWRSGGLKGTNSGQAFYVICDETNNTAESVAQGEVRISVGVALQYPAEFIVINISQWTGGSNTVSSL
jgi:phage tail sheath protein FI